MSREKGSALLGAIALSLILTVCITALIWENIQQSMLASARVLWREAERQARNRVISAASSSRNPIPSILTESAIANIAAFEIERRQLQSTSKITKLPSFRWALALTQNLQQIDCEPSAWASAFPLIQSQHTCRANAKDIINGTIFHGNVQIEQQLLLKPTSTEKTLRVLILGYWNIGGGLQMEVGQSAAIELISAGDFRVGTLRVLPGSTSNILIHSSGGKIAVEHIGSGISLCDGVAQSPSAKLRLEAKRGVTIAGKPVAGGSIGCEIPRDKQLWPASKLLATDFP